MPSKKPAAKPIVNAQKAPAKKSAKLPGKQRVSIELAEGKPQNLEDLQDKKQSLMLFIDAKTLSKTGWKDLAQFLRSSGRGVVGICDNCSIVPPPEKKPKKKA